MPFLVTISQETAFATLGAAYAAGFHIVTPPLLQYFSTGIFPSFREYDLAEVERLLDADFDSWQDEKILGTAGDHQAWWKDLDGEGFVMNTLELDHHFQKYVEGLTEFEPDLKPNSNSDEAGSHPSKVTSSAGGALCLLSMQMGTLSSHALSHLTTCFHRKSSLTHLPAVAFLRAAAQSRCCNSPKVTGRYFTC